MSAISKKVNENNRRDIVKNLASNVNDNMDDNGKIEDIVNVWNQFMSMGFEAMKEIILRVEIGS